jgi:hypothetical protein
VSMAISGWIKLHRALADHPISGDPNALSVWIHLLLQANHRPTKRMMNGRMLTLEPGQLITSRKSISEKTGVQESKVERILKVLKSEQQIEQVGTAKFRVISITNWELYQSYEQVDEQQMNNRRTADEQQMNTPGEVLTGVNTQKCEEKSLTREARSSAKSKSKPDVEKPEKFKLPHWIDLSVWTEYLEMRKRIRKPATQRAMELVIKDLARLAEQGHSPTAVLEQSIKKSWTGVFAVKDDNHGNHTQDRGRPSLVERVAAGSKQRQLQRELAAVQPGPVGDIFEGEVIGHYPAGYFRDQP